MTRVSLLTEIPAPFRIPIWNALAGREGIDLELVFLALHQPNRPYQLHRGEWRFAWRVLPGARPTIAGRWLAVNRGAARAVAGADVVVVGGWNQPAFWQAALVARLRRRPLVLWVESTARDSRSGQAAASAAKRRLVASADAVLVPGSASAAYADELGARRVVVAPNAVDLSLFREAVRAARSDREALRERLGLEGCCFLAVGRLAPEKGFDVLLRAVAGVEGATTVVLGAGPEEDRLRREAPPGVRFAGHVARDELPLWYAAADALVAPSRSEPWGFAIQEAAAAGLPIVATDAAGAAHDLVDEGENGFRVPAGDADALAAALQRVAGDPAFRARAGVRSEALAAALTPERWADAVAALVVELSERGPSRGRRPSPPR